MVHIKGQCLYMYNVQRHTEDCSQNSNEFSGTANYHFLISQFMGGGRI